MTANEVYRMWVNRKPSIYIVFNSRHHEISQSDIDFAIDEMVGERERQRLFDIAYHNGMCGMWQHV